jgi:hypothetical protein
VEAAPGQQGEGQCVNVGARRVGRDVEGISVDGQRGPSGSRRWREGRRTEVERRATGGGGARPVKVVTLLG